MLCKKCKKAFPESVYYHMEYKLFFYSCDECDAKAGGKELKCYHCDAVHVMRDEVLVLKEKNEKIMYILINEELKMSTGKIAAQSAHAIRKYLDNINGFTNETLNYYNWREESKIIIVLKAPYRFLKDIEDLYYLYGYKFGIVRDFGYTEVPGNSLTAICLGIEYKSDFLLGHSKLKKQFNRLRLL